MTRINAPMATQLPGSMALGAIGDPLNAFTVAACTAKILKAYGINMNYAPVAYINSELENPVIGVRSFSDNPETVGRFVPAQVKGLHCSTMASSPASNISLAMVTRWPTLIMACLLLLRPMMNLKPVNWSHSGKP